jgi:hypothetical protein
MDEYVISIIISSLALVISLGTFFMFNQQKQTKPKTGQVDMNTKQLQLQAYERLVMLTERIALHNLISRVNQAGLSAKEMQLLLLESIKQEFEYNSSQQIYVSPVAWDAVRNLKEQNMLVINQVGSALPPESTGNDLNRVLLDVLMKQQKGQLHTIVLEALNYEARKMMK